MALLYEFRHARNPTRRVRKIMQTNGTLRLHCLSLVFAASTYSVPAENGDFFKWNQTNCLIKDSMSATAFVGAKLMLSRVGLVATVVIVVRIVFIR